MRVLDNEPFVRAEHLAGDEEGADDIVRDAAARIADDVRIALGDPRKLRGIETAVHAGNDGEAAHRMVRQTTLIAERSGIALVCCADFFDVRSHGHRSLQNIYEKTVRHAGRLLLCTDCSNGTVNVAGTQAARTHIDVFHFTLHKGADTLNIRLPLAFRLYMGVAHVVAAHRALAADLAYTCHCYTSSARTSSKLRAIPEHYTMIPSIRQYVAKIFSCTIIYAYGTIVGFYL